MPHHQATTGARARELAWIAVPFLAYLVLLQRLWFDAPTGDDFDAVLGSTMQLMDARAFGDWMGALVSQHNEHRVVVTRAASLVMAELLGRVDFRLMVLLGNLGLAAIIALFWAEFRGRAGAPLVGAAGFILCQMTHYEGSLLSMAAISNNWVIAFGFASLYFALRPGGWNLAGALACGLLAVGSLASGLFVLPLAAAACALRGLRSRAWLFAAVGLVLWILYLATYQRPPNHPSPLEALRHPLNAAHLFVVVLGGLAPGVWSATAFGAFLLAALGWLALRGSWKEHPTAAVWIAFILVSSAAAAAGRVGFGVFFASRYSINSSCLAAIVLLLLAVRGAWAANSSRRVFVAAAIASLALSWMVWPAARAYSERGRLLAQALPATPDARSDPYFGVQHPNPAVAMEILTRAKGRGLYRPRGELVHAAATRYQLDAPKGAAVFGHVDVVQALGSRVSATGWTDVTAQVPGRVFVASGTEAPREARVTATSRPDLAALMAARLVYGGFRWEAEYDSAEQAARAARSLCLQLETPGHPSRRFAGANAGCGPGVAG